MLESGYTPKKAVRNRPASTYFPLGELLERPRPLGFPVVSVNLIHFCRMQREGF